MHVLLQAVGHAEVSAGWGGFQLAVGTIALGVLTAASFYATTFFRGKGELVKEDLKLKQQQIELQQKELELKRLEVEEKIRAKLKAAATDAAAIAQETSLGRKDPLSGQAKAEIAAAKLVELEPAAADLDGSKLTDMVKLGVATLRQSGASFHMITPSMAPPAEHIPPNRLPAPATVPAFTPATKTLPERPGAKR